MEQEQRTEDTRKANDRRRRRTDRADASSSTHHRTSTQDKKRRTHGSTDARRDDDQNTRTSRHDEGDKHHAYNFREIAAGYASCVWVFWCLCSYVFAPSRCGHAGMLRLCQGGQGPVSVGALPLASHELAHSRQSHERLNPGPKPGGVVRASCDLEPTAHSDEAEAVSARRRRRR